MGYRRQLKPAATKQSLCLVSAERHRRDSYSYTEFNRIFMSYAAAHEFSVVTAEAEQFRDDPEGAQRRIEEAGVGGILTLGDIDETLFSRLRRCGLRSYRSAHAITASRSAPSPRTTKWRRIRSFTH